MDRRLENQRVLVTGGGRGIVKRQASEGPDVVLTYAGNPDNADAQAVVAAVEQTVRKLSGIDILVNN